MTFTLSICYELEVLLRAVGVVTILYPVDEAFSYRRSPIVTGDGIYDHLKAGALEEANLLDRYISYRLGNLKFGYRATLSGVPDIFALYLR